MGRGRQIPVAAANGEHIRRVGERLLHGDRSDAPLPPFNFVEAEMGRQEPC